MVTFTFYSNLSDGEYFMLPDNEWQLLEKVDDITGKIYTSGETFSMEPGELVIRHKDQPPLIVDPIFPVIFPEESELWN